MTDRTVPPWILVAPQTPFKPAFARAAWQVVRDHSEVAELVATEMDFLHPDIAAELRNMHHKEPTS